MKPRRRPLGDMNIVGGNITLIRLEKCMKQKDLLAKIQLEGLDITGSCLSKIEGQTRIVTDKELVILAKALDVSVVRLIQDK